MSYFSCAWFARLVCILEQVNKEILRVGRHEAHVFIVMQKQYWWDAYASTTRQQLYHLVTVIQEREIFKEK